MKFNLKLFVLVGVFVGLRDVWGVEENEDDVFIVAGFEGNKELEAAMNKRRVIKAVYRAKFGGDVDIIYIRFKDKLSSILVLDENGVKDVKAEDLHTQTGNLYYNIPEKVDYTVYFIFKEEIFDCATEGLLKSTESMFEECGNLISADLSNFNTTNVTDMSSMFYKCTALKKLNLSSFDTTNVTDMYGMFFNCLALKGLDLSNFDTKKVTNMSKMFYNCCSLTELDLSKFDTQNVTNMSRMFAYCKVLTELHLSNFDTQNVTDMSSMFDCCTVLPKLDLSKFDTAKVTDMPNMFRCCSELKELNLSKFDFSSVNNMRNIFFGCNFANLYLSKKYEDIRKRCICCGDRYVYINGKRFEELDPKNVKLV